MDTADLRTRRVQLPEKTITETTAHMLKLLFKQGTTEQLGLFFLR